MKQSRGVTGNTSESGEEGYFVSISDLMIGLLFIFIIILMAFAIKYRSAEEELTNNDVIRKLLLEEIQKDLKNNGVVVYVDIGNGVLRLPESLLFPSGTAILSPEGENNVAILAGVLGKILPCYSKTSSVQEPSSCSPQTKGKLESVFIEGHTDEVPIHTAKYKSNWNLAADRALYTYQTLIERQPQLDELVNAASQRLLSVSAYEARRPWIPSPINDEQRKQNRRIDLRFLMATPKIVTTEDASKLGNGLREVLDERP